MRDGASDDQDPQPLALPAAGAVCAGRQGPPSLPSEPIKAPLRSFSSRKFWIIQLEFWLLIEDFGTQCNFVRRAIYKYTENNALGRVFKGRASRLASLCRFKFSDTCGAARMGLGALTPRLRLCGDSSRATSSIGASKPT